MTLSTFTVIPSCMCALVLDAILKCDWDLKTFFPANFESVFHSEFFKVYNAHAYTQISGGKFAEWKTALKVLVEIMRVVTIIY